MAIRTIAFELFQPGSKRRIFYLHCIRGEAEISNTTISQSQHRRPNLPAWLNNIRGNWQLFFIYLLLIKTNCPFKLYFNQEMHIKVFELSVHTSTGVHQQSACVTSSPRLHTHCQHSGFFPAARSIVKQAKLPLTRVHEKQQLLPVSVCWCDKFSLCWLFVKIKQNFYKPLQLPVKLADFMKSWWGASTKSGYILTKRNIISLIRWKYLLHSKRTLGRSQSVKIIQSLRISGKHHRTSFCYCSYGRQESSYSWVVDLTDFSSAVKA